jgi:uncharacterized protein YkwD
MKRFWAFYGFLPMVLLALSLVLGFAGQTAAAPGEARTENKPVFADSGGPISPQTVFELVNLQRERSGLNQLVADESLAELAAARAADMAARQYYAHRDPDGKLYFDYFKDFDIRSGYSCENLDMVFVPSEQQVVDEWLNSLKGHRGCLLNPSVEHAGYASSAVTLISFDGSKTTAYVIVAIHASLHE